MGDKNLKFSQYNKKEKSNFKSENFDKERLDKNTERLLKNFVKDYEGKSQQQIIDEIIKVAQKNRREGKLSNADLDNFYNMLYPMLNGSQKEQLTQIIDSLKKL